jgi:hypothetical protein
MKSSGVSCSTAAHSRDASAQLLRHVGASRYDGDLRHPKSSDNKTGRTLW